MIASLRFRLASLRQSLARAPWGLAGMAMLVALVELGVVGGDPGYVGGVAWCWRYKQQHVGRAVRHEVLCFGDSMVQFGLVPRVIEARTGRSSYNLAVHSGSAPSSYVLFRRALDAGARPSAVVVDFDWVILKDGPASTGRPYPWDELLTLREAAELAACARDPGLFLSILTKRVLPSLRGRHEIRARIASSLDGQPNSQRIAAFFQKRNWDVNFGGQVLAIAPPFADEPPPPAARPRAAAWRCDPVNAAYLGRFLALAQERQIPVYWVIPPISPGCQARWDFEGEQASYLGFVREQVARFPNLVVVDGRHSGYEKDVFQDPVHLNRQGATAFSFALADLINGSRPGTGADPRWRRLPPFQAPPTNIALEDIAQSGLAVMQAAAKARR